MERKQQSFNKSIGGSAEIKFYFLSDCVVDSDVIFTDVIHTHYTHLHGHCQRAVRLCSKRN